MQRSVITTRDGSSSMQIEGTDIAYHSHHGALQEALHIFINSGLYPVLERNPGKCVNVFEMGLGTGLNAWLTAAVAQKHQHAIQYVAVEKYPVTNKELQLLNFNKAHEVEDGQQLLEKLHAVEWEVPQVIHDYFILTKFEGELQQLVLPAEQFDCIYFDAFAPGAQPELWTPAVFEQLFRATVQGGRLLTYCSKGDVRRAMQAAGWNVKKLPGPIGKREIVCAFK